MRQIVILAALIAATATAASAQTWSPRPGAPAVDQHRYQADQNRLEMERLRRQADQRDLEARQGRLEAQITRQRIENARPPEPLPPEAVRAPSLEEARAAREAATRRRQATAAGMNEIDDWLNRAPR